MTRKGQYLVIKRDALREDSWTYGDWRQYIAFRDNGEACCVRHAVTPFWCAMLGLLVLMAVATGVAAAWTVPGGVAWDRVGWTAFVGFLLIGPEAVLSFTSWRLVVVVLTCTSKGDGSWVRDL